MKKSSVQLTRLKLVASLSNQIMRLTDVVPTLSCVPTAGFRVVVSVPETTNRIVKYPPVNDFFVMFSFLLQVVKAPSLIGNRPGALTDVCRCLQMFLLHHYK